MQDSKQVNIIIADALDQVDQAYDRACISYGSRICNDDFEPKKELRELQIKKEAVDTAKEIIQKKLKESL